jgi:hypothetical protein
MYAIKATRFLIMAFILAVGLWLVLWDLIDFLTTGLNDSIWDITIVTNAYPSIIVGLIIIIVWWKMFRMRVF